MPDPIVPLSFGADSQPASQEPKSARRGLCPPRPGARRISRHADLCASARCRHAGAVETLRLPVSLQVWDFTLAGSSELPARDELLRPARRRTATITGWPTGIGRCSTAFLTIRTGRCRMAAPRVWDKSAIEARLVELGSPVRSAARRVGFCRSAAQGRSGRVLLSPAARELAQPDGRELQRRLLGRSGLSRIRIAGPLSRPRRNRRATWQDKQWNETLFQGFLNNKNNFKANGWSRGRRPGSWTSPPTFRITGPFATSPGPSTRASIRHCKR